MLKAYGINFMALGVTAIQLYRITISMKETFFVIKTQAKIIYQTPRLNKAV